jgi:NADPH:quinone reductase-like Zn-dependent oxidoreductase
LPVCSLCRPCPRSAFRAVLANAKEGDLETVRELIETGKVKPVIDRCYPLRDAPEAIRYLEQGHARGKIVIALS